MSAKEDIKENLEVRSQAIPRAASNTVMNMIVSAGLHRDDAPAIQEPPKPMQRTAKLNPLAPEFHVADVQPKFSFVTFFRSKTD